MNVPRFMKCMNIFFHKQIPIYGIVTGGRRYSADLATTPKVVTI